MLQTSQILVSAGRPIACVGIALSLASGLVACGQPGPLYLPTEPAAAKRATLPQSLWPVMPAKPGADAQGNADRNKPPATTSTTSPSTTATPISTEKTPQP